MMLHEVFDSLLTFAAAGERQQQMAEARRAYERQTGEILPQDASFERRIAAFLEWYVLDWRPPGGDPPILDYLRGREGTIVEQERDALQAWRASRLSLLELRKPGTEEAVVDDLLTGGRHRVRPAFVLLGCEAGALVVARLVAGQANGTGLTEGTLYLPNGARKPVRAAAKALRKAGAPPKAQLELLLRLTAFITRCERYRHVDPRTLWEASPLRPAQGTCATA